MRKLEEFVNEKLKVTTKSGNENTIIMTTLRKFLAWFTGEPEHTINKYDIEDRKFISSDKSMSKDDITNFLYRHINDAIYISEEVKEYHSEILIGLRDEKESKSILYDYSFEINGKEFSIDARIYTEKELLSKNIEYFYKIVEKLKVSAKESVPFEKIDMMEFARALRKSGTIFIDNYTDDLICDRRYRKLHSKYYNEMYLYSLGLKHPSDPYPNEIEFVYKTKDKNGTRRDYVKDEDDLVLLSRFTEGGDFKALIEEIYNDIV